MSEVKQGHFHCELCKYGTDDVSTYMILNINTPQIPLTSSNGAFAKTKATVEYLHVLACKECRSRGIDGRYAININHNSWWKF
jgi:hypothetical protein